MTLRELLLPWMALAALKLAHADLQAKYDKLTDRDDRGRFTKRED